VLAYYRQNWDNSHLPQLFVEIFDLNNSNAAVRQIDNSMPIEGAAYYPYQNVTYNSIDPFNNNNNNNQLWIPHMADGSLSDMSGYSFVANHGL
jgi:hypothetical protein